jgi:hypothetical protein
MNSLFGTRGQVHRPSLERRTLPSVREEEYDEQNDGEVAEIFACENV